MLCDAVPWEAAQAALTAAELQPELQPELQSGIQPGIQPELQSGLQTELHLATPCPHTALWAVPLSTQPGAILWTAQSPGPEAIRLDGPGALAEALKTAQGGERFLLAPGDYGTLSLRNRRFGPPVTLIASPAGRVAFDKIALTGGGGFILDGLFVAGELRAEGGLTGLTILRSEIDGGVYLKEVAQIDIADSIIRGGHHALILNDVTDAALTANLIARGVEDLLRITGGSQHIRVIDNSFRDVAPHRPMHPDLIQFFGFRGRTPTDILIRGNHLYDDPATGSMPAQGIFLSDPADGNGYRNIVIAENLINVGSFNSIYINGGQENVVVRNNSLIPWPDGSGAVIRLAEKAGLDNSGTVVTGNVLRRFADETKASIMASNLAYEGVAPPARLFSGPGAAWRDFLPLPGSHIDFASPFGAQTRLKALQAGDE